MYLTLRMRRKAEANCTSPPHGFFLRVGSWDSQMVLNMYSPSHRFDFFCVQIFKKLHLGTVSFSTDTADEVSAKFIMKTALNEIEK